MTQDQENTVSMFETTVAFLDSNSSLWRDKAALAATVAEAKTGITAIRAAAATQESPTGGITEEKEQARARLEDLTLQIADLVSAWTAKNSDPGVGAQVHLTRSSLDQAQDDQLVQIAERVHGVANVNLEALKDYEVTPADMSALASTISKFAGMKIAPRAAKAARSGMTQSVASLVGATRSLFRNQLDKLMTPFRKSNPEFYTGYISARVIIDRSATRHPKSAEAPGASPSGPAPSPAPSPAPPK